MTNFEPSESGAAKLLARKADIVAQHTAMLLSVAACGENLSDQEEKIVRNDLRELRVASERIKER